MVEMQFKKGLVGLLSDEDADLISECKWGVAGPGYVSGSYQGKQQYLHRVVLSRVIGRELVKGEYSDHINRNRLDNRRENLRVVTNRQNLLNRELQDNNTSGYRGVWYYKGQAHKNIKKRWAAEIKIVGKRKFLGFYETAKEAAQAYDNAARESNGEFARLNFPDSESPTA
jgi:hypothetical protein